MAAIYILLIGFFAWQMRYAPWVKLLVSVAAGAGALLVNGLRVAFLTTLFLSYPTDLVEAVHTNLGDLIFLAYALLCIAIVRHYRG